MTRSTKPAPVVPIRATIETSIKVQVRLPPGQWIMGTWSIVRIDFDVYRDRKTGRWFTHVSYGNFRAVRGQVSANGARRDGKWFTAEVYPGFNPKIEHIPLMVLDIVRETYEAYGVSPEILPPPDVVKGKAPVR